MARRALTVVGTMMLVAAVVWGVAAFGGGTSAEAATGEDVTREGTIVCLPKRASGPATLECRFGLRDAAGAHHAFHDLPDDPEALDAFRTGVRARVHGRVRPAAPDTAYDVVDAIVVERLEILDGGASAP